MAHKILHRRGLRAGLPTLTESEFGFSTDTKELHIGSSVGNLRVMGDYITPEMYGAKGDGVHDDTAAIQAAIDTAEDAGGGFVLCGPNKTYLISSSLYHKSGVHIFGAGINSTIKASNTFPVGEYLIKNHGTVGAHTYRAGIRDINLDGNYRAGALSTLYAELGFYANLNMVGIEPATYALLMSNWTVLNSFFKLYISAIYGIHDTNSGVGAGHWSGHNSFYDPRLQSCIKALLIDGFCTRELISAPMIDCDSASAETRGIELGAEPSNCTVIGGAIENTSANGTGLLAATAGGHVFLNVKISGGFATERNVNTSDIDIIAGDVKSSRAISQDRYVVLNGRFSGVSPNGTMTWAGDAIRCGSIAGDGAYDLWDFPIEQPQGAVIKSISVYAVTDDAAAETKLEIFKMDYNDASATSVASQTFVGTDFHQWTGLSYTIEANYYYFIQLSGKRSAGTYMYLYPIRVMLDYL